ncbi:MAG TPA: DNA polymerase III subunit delta [Moraxellaceae bacterium]|nr:DNA polymerase III subunit delta [Moraxellaceae bacterium]
MKLRADQLPRHLKEPLQPLYVVHGDEVLLLQEAGDQLRAAARAQGFSERELWHAERGADWNELLASANNLSLFGDRKLIEIRFTGKPDATASAALERYAAAPAPDTLLLLILPRLDGTAQKAKWFIACENAGASVMVPDIDAGSLPDWLRSRLQQQGVMLEPDAFTLLCERVEGNLLAAQQEIEKLRLLAPEGVLTLELVRNAVGDSARYNVYDLADAALAGDAERAARLLTGLQAEGQSESGILWAIARDARTLAALREGVDAGQAAGALMQQNGIWQKRQGLFQRALQRTSSALARRLVDEIQAADLAIKGQSQERAWDVLLRLVMLMAGRPLFA